MEEERGRRPLAGCNVISTSGQMGLQRVSLNIGRQYTGYSGMERRVYIWEVGMHAAFEAHAQFALGGGGKGICVCPDRSLCSSSSWVHGRYKGRGPVYYRMRESREGKRGRG